jgi:hypothetical protein
VTFLVYENAKIYLPMLLLSGAWTWFADTEFSMMLSMIQSFLSTCLQFLSFPKEISLIPSNITP